MSISPAISALRTTGVAPSAVRSSVLIPDALSNRRIICPIITDSLESLEETTTVACDALAAPSTSSANAIRDFSRVDKWRLHLGPSAQVVGCCRARQAHHRPAAYLLMR